MKSNFTFLEKYWPVLAQIGGAAENYLYSDPNACMYKIGTFAERLVQEMMVFEGIPEPSFDNTQANRIRLLKRTGLLPTDIDNTLFALRKSRNDDIAGLRGKMQLIVKKGKHLLADIADNAITLQLICKPFIRKLRTPDRCFFCLRR